MNELVLPGVLSKARAGLRQLEGAGRANLFEHDRFPGKLLRLESETYAIHKALPYFKRYLEEIEARYQIPTVHPEFVMSAEALPPVARSIGMKPPAIDILAVIDKIDGAPAESLLDSQELSSEAIDEFDLLSCRMVAQLSDVYEHGGFHCQEIYRYSQFMYDAQAPAGQRLILVDIEPLGFYFHLPPEQRPADSIPIELVEAMADITSDVITLEKKTGLTLAARSAITDFINAVELQGRRSMSDAKRLILAALATQDTRHLEHFKGLDDGIFSDEWSDNSSRLVEHLLEKGVDI